MLTGFLNIWVTVVVTAVAAILGDNVGYSFGRRVGHRIFNRKDSLLFHKDNLLKAQQFYEKHGPKTLVLARFMPVVRTFAPILAGVGKMHWYTFVFYNFFGGLLWTIGLTLLGYFLGNAIPDIDKYLLPIIAVIIIASVAPSAIHMLKSKSHREQIMALVRHVLRKLHIA